MSIDPVVLANRAVKYFAALQKPSELANLIALASRTLRPGDAIVEIGCDAGGTLMVWRRLAGFVVGIDKPNGPFGTGRRLLGYGAFVIRADSHKSETQFRLGQLLEDRPVGLLFIDGDHTYAGVKSDYAMYAPFVRSGGLVALHDICEHNKADVEVARFWREIGYTAQADELISEPRTWGGIGIIHVA